MKNYHPSPRENILVAVLQFDTESQEKGSSFYFTTYQRILINQERAAIMAGSEYHQNSLLESKIAFVFELIKTTNWIPEKPIPYV